MKERTNELECTNKRTNAWRQSALQTEG